MTRQVGIVGVGRMGMAICARIAEAGIPVTATDARRELESSVTAAGARWADSLSELASACDVVLTVLPGADEVTALIDPLLDGLAPGSTWIDLTSATPDVADRIAPAARHRDVRTLDAPVGGSPRDARSGRLLVFAGGTAEDLEAQRQLLETVASRVVHVGHAGRGYLVKLLVNFLWFMQAVAAGEALAIATRCGLEPETLRDAVQHSAAASRFMDADAPALLRGDVMPAFSLRRCLEELEGLLALTRRLDTEPALIERVTELYADALGHYGDADGELLAAHLVADRAGVQFGDRGS